MHAKNSKVKLIKVIESLIKNLSFMVFDEMKIVFKR